MWLLLPIVGDLPHGALPVPPGGLSALSTPDSDSSTGVWPSILPLKLGT